MPKQRKDIDDKKDYIVDSLLSGNKTPTELCLELNCKPDTLRARTLNGYQIINRTIQRKLENMEDLINGLLFKNIFKQKERDAREMLSIDS